MHWGVWGKHNDTDGMMRQKQGKVMQGANQGMVMHQLCTDGSGGLPPVGLADLDPCIWRHTKG